LPNTLKLSANSPGMTIVARAARSAAARDQVLATSSSLLLAPGRITSPLAFPSIMAYDEELAHRIRALLADEPGITEKAMFGGLAFLTNGNMTVSASGQGGLMARIDPADAEEAISEPHAAIMVMRGREMPGWIRVQPDGLKTQDQLESWVHRALAYVRTLAPKS
jgi:TfoX/Sxy family transcriptional regulator of competence genes